MVRDGGRCGVNEPHEFTFTVEMLVTARDKNDAYSQISDSGISSGALIGTVLVLGLDVLVDEGPSAGEEEA